MRSPRFVYGGVGAAIGIIVPILLGGSVLAARCIPAVQPQATRPNFIIVQTDDLDMGLWQEMALRDTIGGRHFLESFVTSPVCCPSKASTLTGLYAHHHGVLSNSKPEGGHYAALQSGMENCTLPVWLKAAGYYTGFMGRYLVGYGWRDSGPDYVPPGWDSWIGRLTRTKAGYQDIRFSFDGVGRTLPGDEGTHYLPQARAFIQRAGDRPYFLLLAPMAPHAPWGGAPYPGDPQRRLSTLRPIEDLVSSLLEEIGPNTYLIFTSDNGFHLEPAPGKARPWDTDTRVPLVFVGPTVAPGQDTEHFALNIDVAPTIAELAGVRPPVKLDGVSLVPLLRGEDPAWRDRFPIELPTFTAERTATTLVVHWVDGRTESLPVGPWSPPDG